MKTFFSKPVNKQVISFTLAAAIIVGSLIVPSICGKAATMQDTTTSSTDTTSSSVPSTSSTSSVPSVSVKSVSLSKKTLTMKVGTKFRLTANVNPADATNKTLKWTTSNSKIAVVNSTGTITAKKSGAAYIRATSVNGIRSACLVKVVAKSTKKSVKSSKTKPVAKVPASYFTQDNYNKNCKNKHTKIGTTIVTICPSAGAGYMDVSVTGSVQKYAGKDIIMKLYKNGKIDKSQCGISGAIGGNEKTATINFGADTYERNHLYWLTPASYRIDCYAGGHKFCSVTFRVNERGFC